MSPTDWTDALRAASALGPYFVVEHATPDADWFPLAALTDSSDTSLLAERVASVRIALARMAGTRPENIDLRAAASTHALALCSRLVAPALATATLAKTVVHVGSTELCWQPVPGGPVPMRLTNADATAASDVDALAELIHEHVITTAVEPLVRAFADTFRLSTQVLWGNVASAFAGAATMLGQVRPAEAARAREIVDAATDTPSLKGAGGYGVHGYFLRTNCCLFYRVPGGGYCGDCVIRQR